MRVNTSFPAGLLRDIRARMLALKLESFSGYLQWLARRDLGQMNPPLPIEAPRET